MPVRLFFLTSLLLLTAVSAHAQTDDNAAAWDALRSAIDADDLDNIAVVVGTADGVVFAQQKGDFDPNAVIEIASASKWLTAATVLRLVEAGVLSLDDHPQDYLDWWTSDPDDPRSQMTLEQLLSLTSGMEVSPFNMFCMTDNGQTLQDCVGQIAAEVDIAAEPGTRFSYNSENMQVAGAMLEAATGQPFNAVFRQQVADPVGMAESAAYTVPSRQSPILAAGVTMTTLDYALFLEALLRGDLLTPETQLNMTEPRSLGMDWGQSPLALIAEDYPFEYGLGVWRECSTAEWSVCSGTRRVSSAGIFGFYPWLDYDAGYYAIIAQQKGVLTLASVGAYRLGDDLRPLIEVALGAN